MLGGECGEHPGVGGWTTAAAHTEAQIFQVFKNYWTNAGGNVENAWRWWISGAQPAVSPGSAYVFKSGGGNYFARDFDSLYRSSNTSETMSKVDQYLHAGYGVSLKVDSDMKNGHHFLTVWGYEYTSTGKYSGIWITDSDDHEHGLYYLGVFYDNLWRRWYLIDINLTGHKYDLWYITKTHGLYNNFGKGSGVAVAGSGSGSGGSLATGASAIPEPGVPALLPSGLLALALALYRSVRGSGSGIAGSGAAGLTSARIGPAG